jgi:hypothetical protein
MELLNLCGRWAGRRNDIAHGLVDMNADDARWYLFPSLYGTKGRKLMTNPVPGRPLLQKSGYRHSAEIIDAFSDEFLELHNQMNRVVSAMGEWDRINNSWSSRTAHPVSGCSCQIASRQK